MYSVKMCLTIWLLVAFLAADATQFQKSLPRSELPLAHPEIIEDFKNLLQKALDLDATYHRDLLVTSGIVPAPPSYGSPNDEGSDIQPETTLSPEVREHFDKHVKDMLASLDKLDSSLISLFGKRLFQSLLLSEVPKDDSRSEASTDVDCDVEANSRSTACTVRSSAIPELPSLPAVDFVMAPDSENEFVTSASVVDKITTEYVRMFSEETESSTPSDHRDVSTSSHGDGVSTLTPLDDEFIMHVMSSSIPPSVNQYNSNGDESTTYSENEIRYATESLSTDATVSDSKSNEAPETESDPIYVSPIYGRVLTIEEVKLLDKSLSLKPELKYHVISTSQPDQTLSDVHFYTTDETSSSKPISKKRRRMNPRDISLDEPIFFQAPTPEKMILRYYRDIPDTSFTCENKSLPGFYADQEADCQVFHVCWPGRRESFLCPVGSLFNQQVLSCDNFNNTNCSLSHAYFDVNTAFQEYDDAKAHNVTPSPDPMMRPIQNDSGTTEVVATKSEIVELFEADLQFSEMVTKTNITELWDYLPVKAKVFVYPEPADLKKFLEEHHHHHHKIRKSKDVRGLDSSTEMEDSTAAEEILDEVLENRQRIESNILRVLKKLSRKHRN